MLLFIPGPVDVREDVLKEMAKPMISHRGKEISDLGHKIEQKLQKLMFTNNAVLLSSSSGTGAMEMAVRSLTKHKAAVFSMGAFGDRFFNIAKGHGVDCDKFSVDYGKHITPEMLDEALKTGQYDTLTVTHNETSTGVMNNLDELSEVWKKYPDVIVIVDTVSSLAGYKIEVDRLAIDCLVASTQKALALPPGLAVMSVSEKAVKRLDEVQNRGYYFDLKNVYLKHISSYQYPSTPNVSLMYAMDYQLEYILNQEGLENRFKRHQEMAEYTRKFASENYELFAEEGYQSQTVTTIVNTKDSDTKVLSQKLKELGYVMSDGYGKLKGKVIRVPHMGDRTFEELVAYLKAIKELW